MADFGFNKTLRFGSMAVFRSLADPDPIMLDCALEAAVSRAAETTRSPIETGASVVDHRRTMPETIRFRAVLTSEPVDHKAAAERAAAAGSRDTVLVDGRIAQDPLKRTLISMEPIDHLRADKILDELVQIHAKGTIVVLWTDRYEIESVQLKTLQDREIGDGAIEVAGTFEVVRFATSREVPLPAESVRPQATPTKKRGTKPTKKADEATVERTITDTLVGDAIVDGVKSVFGLGG